MLDGRQKPIGVLHLPNRFGQNLLIVAARKRLVGKAPQFDEALVVGYDPAIVVDDEDAIGGCFLLSDEHGVATAEGGLGLLALGDVEMRAHHAPGRTVLVPFGDAAAV